MTTPRWNASKVAALYNLVLSLEKSGFKEQNDLIARYVNFYTTGIAPAP